MQSFRSFKIYLSFSLKKQIKSFINQAAPRGALFSFLGGRNHMHIRQGQIIGLRKVLIQLGGSTVQQRWFGTRLFRVNIRAHNRCKVLPHY